VSKRTNGRVQVEWHFGGTLVKSREHINAIGAGTVDMGVISSGYTPDKIPLTFLTGIPGLSNNLAALNLARWELYKTFTPLQQEWESRNIQPLAHAGNLEHTVGFVDQPVTTLAELKGKRVRAPGATIPLLIEPLGPKLQRMKVAEVYDGLSKGVVDGCAAPINNMVSYRWYEVTKYVTWLDGSGAQSQVTIGMNKDVWDSLPKDVQKVMMELAEEYAVKNAEILEAEEADQIAQMEAAGVKFYHLDAAAQKVLGDSVVKLSDTSAKDLDSKGLPGTELMERFIQIIRETENKLK